MDSVLAGLLQAALHMTQFPMVVPTALETILAVQGAMHNAASDKLKPPTSDLNGRGWEPCLEIPL